MALVGTEVWSSGDQISVTPPAGANLEAFRKWRNDHLVKRKKHDNAHLIRWGEAFPAVAMEMGGPPVSSGPAPTETGSSWVPRGRWSCCL